MVFYSIGKIEISSNSVLLNLTEWEKISILLKYCSVLARFLLFKVKIAEIH